VPFDFDQLAELGCMGRAWAASSVRRPAPTCAIWRATCCASGPHESCGKCFPCRIGLRRAHDMFRGAPDGRPGQPRAAPRSAPRSARWLRSRQAACRRRSAACSPTTPMSWGSRDASHRRRVAVEVEPDTTILIAIPRGGRKRCRRSASTLARIRSARAGSVLVGVAGARGPLPALHDAVSRRDGDRHRR